LFSPAHCLLLPIWCAGVFRVAQNRPAAEIECLFGEQRRSLLIASAELIPADSSGG
jgi:hypothetical protein